jgi:hypothetical protein
MLSKRELLKRTGVDPAREDCDGDGDGVTPDPAVDGGVQALRFACARDPCAGDVKLEALG